ncbi:MAG: hypothetical protein Q4B22_01610 [Eubacteriales bacterium]|nr:hypothetical protein [Eubacteriales bacterium]
MKKRLIAALLICGLAITAVPAYAAEEGLEAELESFVTPSLYYTEELSPEEELENEEEEYQETEDLLFDSVDSYSETDEEDVLELEEVDLEDEEDLLGAKNQNMYRMYNLYSGEHFYTASAAERENLCKAGWRYEGIGWVAPAKTKKTPPVYRMYNKNAGDHHYTMSKGERDGLIRLGWKYEGIGWYSDASRRVPLYRAYNPNAKAGSHNYTTNKAEQNNLCRIGWKNEGRAWYGAKKGALLSNRTYRIIANTSENDQKTNRTRFGKYNTIWIHYQMFGGDSSHEENYTIYVQYPDGEISSRTDTCNQKYELTLKVGWSGAIYRAPSGTTRAWITNSAGQKEKEISFYWGN